MFIKRENIYRNHGNYTVLKDEDGKKIGQGWGQDINMEKLHLEVV